MRLQRPVFRNMPLQRKLLLFIIPLLAVTVGVTGLYSYLIASREVVDKIRQAQLNVAVKTRDQLDYFANNTVSFSNYLFLNPTVQELVMNGDTPHRRDLVLKSLLPLMVTEETIQSLIIYSSRGKGDANSPFAITHTGIASAASFDRFMETDYYKRSTEAPRKQLWDIFKPSDHILIGDSHYKLVYIRPYKSFYDYKQNGMIIVGMDADRLSRNLFHDEEDGLQFIMSSEGIILAALNTSWIGKPITALPPFADIPPEELSSPAEALTRLKANEQYIVSDSLSETTGFHAVVIQDRSALVAELKYIGSVTISIMAALGLIAILLSWLIARYLTTPLKKLMQSMKALQIGDFSQRVNFSGNDEIGRLGYLYNNMVSRIKSLIDDVYASSLKQREAELKALQSQINPHFLYNTLNMINWSAVQKGDKDISEMVVALSQVFRLSLNSGNEFVELEQEIELVRYYLFLQKKRFPSRLSFDIELDPSLKSFRMPKLLLQPLVENAVLYAIEQAEGTGHIYVSASRDNGSVLLEVTDNGPGMAPELIERLLGSRTGASELLVQESRSGMAIANIKERLALFYKEAVFDIESKESLGTRMQIRIKEEEAGHDR